MTVAQRRVDRQSPTMPDTRAGDQRPCPERACAWRGTCPIHGAGDDFDQRLALLIRERPYVAPMRAG